jgi:hypothetical protein
VTVSLSLMLTGTDDEPRWVTDVRHGGQSASQWRYCCEAGHYTPEAAAAHGSETAAAWLSREARALAPHTSGAMALAKAGTA